MQHQILQGDYTSLGGSFQLCLPLNFEFQIPKDDPVRLLRHFVDEMDLSALYQTFSQANKNRVQPRQMFAILIYAYLNGIYSSRRIESACRRDINFMYLLEGKPAPDHATIARFRSKHVAPCAKKLLAQMTDWLEKIGAISFENIFIDGTKIESAANKYRFVWKKAVKKNLAKLQAKLPDFLQQVSTDTGIRVRHGETIKMHHLKKLRRRLARYKKEQGIVFVHGIGRRKTPLQRLTETLDEYIRRLKDYHWKLHTCGRRNSFAKTDTDATFMRMKEDAMKNGQLKPAYNIQYGSEAQFIVWADVFPKPTDTTTLIPFLEGMHQHLGRRYPNIVADAGYESEENYAYLKAHKQTAYIKPNNYEASKTRKWKHDIGRRENMQYLPDEDAYLCSEGRKLVVSGIRHAKSRTGFVSEKTCYTCKSCKDCPRKADCIHGNHSKQPLDERTKHFEVAKFFQQERQEDLARITSEHGIELRVNRSIQAEGAFADVKADRNYRRFLTKGHVNVEAETILLAMAHNIFKLHCKIQAQRLGVHLIQVAVAA